MKLEIKGKFIRGNIALGSKIGYTGKDFFKLQDVIDVLHKVNLERNNISKLIIPITIRESVLIGRSKISKYQEKIYILEFYSGPRGPKISKSNFLKILKEYAISLGMHLKQERLYIDFNGISHVLKRN